MDDTGVIFHSHFQKKKFFDQLCKQINKKNCAYKSPKFPEKFQKLSKNYEYG